MDLFAKMAQLAAENGGTVITGSSAEELAEKVKAHISAEESMEKQDAESALNITARMALRYATAAMMGSGAEFNRGHQECARFKQDAAAVWLSLAEALEREESQALTVSELGGRFTEALRAAKDNDAADAVLQILEELPDEVLNSRNPGDQVL